MRAQKEKNVASKKLNKKNEITGKNKTNEIESNEIKVNKAGLEKISPKQSR